MKKILFLFLITLFMLTGCKNKCEHNWEVNGIYEADCENGARTVYACKNCFTTKTIYSSYALGHNFEVTTPGDPKKVCTDEAFILIEKCNRCNKEQFSGTRATHEFISKDILKEPTCTESGIALYKCVYCQTTEERELNKLSHRYVKSGEDTEPTCITEGIKQGYYCALCLEELETYPTEVLPKIPHNFKDGVCTECEQTQTYKINYFNGEELIDTYEIELSEFKDDLTIEHITPKIEQNQKFLGWFTTDKQSINNETIITQSLFNEENTFNLYASIVDVVLISTVEDFNNIKNDISKYYLLANNIDFNNEALPFIKDFKGTIDGNNKSISNFKLTASSVNGNFGLIGINTGTIRDINLSDYQVTINLDKTTGSNIGILAGTNNGTIENINLINGTSSVTYLIHNQNTTLAYGNLVGKNTGTIENVNINNDTNLLIKTSAGENGAYTKDFTSHYMMGGLAGLNEGNILSSSFNSGINVESRLSGMTTTGFVYFYYYAHTTNALGGLVGKNYSDAIIKDCYTTGSIKYQTTTMYNSTDKVDMGGMVGQNLNSSQIKTSYTNLVISGGAKNGTNSGGFVGVNDNTASIKSCYASVTLSSLDNVSDGNSTFAGFVGINNANIQTSYSEGIVSTTVNSFTSGFVSKNNQGGSITKSYSTCDVSSKQGYINKFLTSNSGAINKIYTISTSTLTNNGSQTTNNLATEVNYSTLISYDNLVNNLFWEDIGWYIGNDASPFLEWEFTRSHNYTEPETYDPTCTEVGFTVYECVDCNKIFMTDFKPALGHTKQGEAINITNPTHTTDGLALYNCIHNHQYEEILPKTGHSIPSTIECDDELITISDGKYYYTCDCEELVLLEDTILNHKPINVDYKAPQCGSFDEENEEWINESFGQTQGSICEHCNKTLFGNKQIEPHIYELKENKETPTCQSNGIDIYECRLCSKTKEITIPTTTHTYSDKTFKCSECEASKYTIDETYTPIATYEDLSLINTNPKGNYYLTADIILTDITFNPLCNKDNPFEGILLGNGYSIKNLTLSSSNPKNNIYAFIEYNKGVIAGLTFENSSINITNIAIAQASIICGYNSGEIFMCEVKGDTKINLTASVLSTTLDEVIKGYNYTFGGITSTNEKTGIIDGCKVSENVEMNYITEALLESDNVKGYFDKLLNVTKVENSVMIISGGISGINHGSINNTAFKPNLTYHTSTDSYVGGISRGKTYLYVTLFDGGFVGINTGSISNSTSISKTYYFHSYDSPAFIYDDPIMINNVVIKIEYEKVVNNSVLGDYNGLIGQNTGIVTEFTKEVA